MPPSPAARKRRASNSGQEYDVTIEGMYFAPSANTSGLAQKPYRVTVKLTQNLVNEGPLSVWKNALAPEMMPKLYPDYQGLATHEIVKSVPLGGGQLTDISLMNMEQLTEYIHENELPVEAELYQDIGALQQAVLDCEKDEDVFVVAQEALKARVGTAISVKNQALSLNPPSAIKSTVEEPVLPPAGGKLGAEGAAKGIPGKKDKLADL
jgi:hypothetical protein